ncbi:hypothetical protein GCM10008967_02830 [Bacillus carboniphilus]|uniref:Lipoprotein n=1 Tax=Bacillus carboniphilus TaxID=86663 RepID=A0ABN0VRU9_9BACI
MKWLKWTLGIIAVIILGVAGTVYYFFEIKEYDTADAEVEEITKTEYDIVLPPNVGEDDVDQDSSTNEESTEEQADSDSLPATSTEVDEEESDSESNQTGNTGTNQNSSDQKKQDSNNDNSKDKTDSNDDTKKDPVVTADYIKDRYRPTFESLQAQANSRLDALIAKAISEYRAQKSAGKSVSFGYFYQKYKGAADELEANTDATFNIIIGALNDELEKNGFTTKESKEFRDYYEAQKEAREDALLERARELL